MRKLPNISQAKLNVTQQMTCTLETNTSVEQAQQPGHSQLYNKKTIGHHPGLKNKRDKSSFWLKWFDGANTNVDNPLIAQISEEAAQELIDNDVWFAHGVDFQHLPPGFFMEKSDLSALVPDVLHFDKTKAYLARHALNYKLDHIQTVKIECSSEIEKKWWEHLKQQHLQTLQNKLNKQDREKSVDALYISFREFITFLSSHRLALPDFNPETQLQNLNVVSVSLGRMVTIIDNAAPCDRQEQLLACLDLDLSVETIRAITDNQKSEKPCRFINAEMSLIKTKCPTQKIDDRLKKLMKDAVKWANSPAHSPEVFVNFRYFVSDYEDLVVQEKNFQDGLLSDQKRLNAYSNFKFNGYGYNPFSWIKKADYREAYVDSSKALEKINEKFPDVFAAFEKEYNSENYFLKEKIWRFLAFQKQRRSVDFYRKAFDSLEQISKTIEVTKKSDYASGEQRTQLIQAYFLDAMSGFLVGSTCGSNHQDISDEEALQSWKTVCKTIAEAKLAGTVSFAAAVSGVSITDRVIRNYIRILNKFDVLPNLDMLASVIKFAGIVIKNAGFISGADDEATLVRLGHDASNVSAQTGDGFNQGCRFYRDQELSGKPKDTWIVKSASLMDGLRHYFPEMCSHVSTFDLTQDNVGFGLTFLTVDNSKLNSPLYLYQLARDKNEKISQSCLALWLNATKKEAPAGATMTSLFCDFLKALGNAVEQPEATDVGIYCDMLYWLKTNASQCFPEGKLDDLLAVAKTTQAKLTADESALICLFPDPLQDAVQVLIPCLSPIHFQGGIRKEPIRQLLDLSQATEQKKVFIFC